MTDALNSQIEIPEAFRILESPGDGIVSWELLLSDLAHGALAVPAHQRAPGIWPFEKQRRFVERLKQAAAGCHPPGAVATYQLRGRDGKQISPVFLNDGFQRLTTMQRLKAEPTIFGLDDEGATALLRLQVPRQHRHYIDHKQAMRDFQLINAGTQLTPWEFCTGHLLYMDNYELWEPVFEQVREILGASEIRLQSSSARIDRTVRHRHNRDNLALLHRFMSGEKGPTTYRDVGMTDVDRLVERKDVIELRILELISSTGTLVRDQLPTFRQHIERETALLITRSRAVLGDGRGLQPVLWRFLLHFSIWRRNNNVPVTAQKAFIDKALIGAQGKSQWLKDDRGYPFALADLTRLTKFVELAEMPELLEKTRRRRGSELLPGYDNSHLQPFVTNGDGETFAEPGSLNRARGPRPVGNDDLPR